MNGERIFRPQTTVPRRRVLQTALVAVGFFIVVQIAFLDGLAMRLVFSVFFGVFIAVGAWMSVRSARSWPQEVRMNANGISYGSLRRRHGIDSVPWSEIARMDLFYTGLEGANFAPFLRIGLRDGELRKRLRRPRRLRGAGLDVNIPLAVDAEPQEVLEAARKLWKEYRHDHG